MARLRDHAVMDAARHAGAPQGLTLAIAGFLPVLTILSLAPAVPSLISHFQRAPYANIIVPLIVTAPGLMVALISPFAGAAVDRYGRRNLILAATLLYAIAGIAPFFVSSLPVIFGTRLLVGLAEAFILVIVNTLFADYFTVERRRTWITAQGLTGPILGTASIATSGALTSHVWNGAFLIYGLALLVFLAMVAFLFEPVRAEPHDTPVEGEAAEAFPIGAAVMFCGVTLLASILYYVFIVQSGLAFAAIGVGSSARLGVLISIASLGTPLGAVVFNIISRKASSAVLIATLLGLMGVGMIGMGLARDATMMTAFGFVQQMGAGVTVAGLIFWVSRLLAPEHRGRGFGVWSSAFFAGQFLSPLAVGVVRGVTGTILLTFVTMGVIALAAAALAVALGRLLPKVK